MEMVLGMLFLSLNNVDIDFKAKRLTWKKYSAIEILPIIRRVELIDKEKFVQVVLDEYSETFVVYVATLETIELIMYLF